MGGKHGAGKGSNYRPVNQKKYDENWEKVFGKNTKNKNSKGEKNGSKKEK